MTGPDRPEDLDGLLDAPYVDDGGFTGRVMGRLPPPGRRALPVKAPFVAAAVAVAAWVAPDVFGVVAAAVAPGTAALLGGWTVAVTGSVTAVVAVVAALRAGADGTG